MKRPTIYDVAERAGVSKSLVSLVLRDSPRVSAERREAVLTAMRELDYTPSRLAAGLAGTRTRSVGVVIDDFANLWFVEALAGLRESLAAGGYSLSVADTRLNAHLSLDPIAVFRALRVDGVVLAGEASPEAVRRFGVPAVVLGTRALGGDDAAGRGAGSGTDPAVPVIASDEAEGGRLAVRHLAGLGHRRIACVSGPGASAGERERGYSDEMRTLGFEPNVVRAAETSEAAARAVAGELWAGSRTAERPTAGANDAPTAVFAVNDPMAVGVIGAARAAGRAFPEELSVVGYDDSPLAAYALLSLTTVSGDSRHVGEQAGRTLVSMIEGAERPASMRFVPRLVERASTVPPAR